MAEKAPPPTPESATTGSDFVPAPMKKGGAKRKLPSSDDDSEYYYECKHVEPYEEETDVDKSDVEIKEDVTERGVHSADTL
jgi:hypothetical protein